MSEAAENSGPPSAGDDAIRRKIQRWRPNVSKNPALKDFFAGSDLTEDEIYRTFEDPKLAQKVMNIVHGRNTLRMGEVYEKMFEEATVKGNVPAAKLLAQRYDPEYRERKESIKSVEIDVPTREDFLEKMEFLYGEEEVEAARILARKSGKRGGVFGEEFLPGGAAEFDDEEEIVEADFDQLPSPAPEPSDDDEIVEF